MIATTTAMMTPATNTATAIPIPMATTEEGNC